MSTYYAALEVIETASIEAIKGAYKHLAQKWHPDKNLGNMAEATMRTAILNEAYAVLSDPLRREKYDAAIRKKQQAQKESNKPDDKDGNKKPANATRMKALTPSPDLAVIVGAHPLPRTEIVSKLWLYIKAKGLQDKINKRMINADANLLKIFGKRQVSMFEVAGLIGKHVK